MSRDIVPLGLRMPPEVKEQIEAAAKANGRSMNAEIVARLQASFEPLSGHEKRDLQAQTILEVAKLSMTLFEMMRDAKSATFPETVMHSVERIHDMLESMTGKKDD